MERIDPRARSDVYGARINRAHSPTLAMVVPWLSVLIASIVPVFFIASGLPWLPPLGFMMLLAWRLVRPGLFPVWAGAPLGFFDDLFSGQPLGSAVLLWSLSLLAIELLETRLPWRSFVQDWFTAGLVLVVYCPLAMLASGASPSLPMLIALGPQIMLSIFLFPVFARLIAALDRFRLRRRRVG